MRVALFTKQFLEPTHHAIIALLNALQNCQFSVYSKRMSLEVTPPHNVIAYALCPPNSCPTLSRQHCDIVHTIFDGDLSLAAATAALRAELPFIISFHGGFDVHVKILRHDYVQLARKLIQSASAVTVVCQSDANRLRSLGIERHIDVIRVPIDLDNLPEGYQARPGHLIVIARLVEKKGVDTAIEALYHLPKMFHLTIVGDGPLEPALRQRARVLGLAARINFAGRLSLEDTLSFASVAEALIHPARVASDGNAEGTPQAVLWAQALGLPVIASDSGSLCEIVTHRRTGLLVQQNDPVRIAGAVLELRSADRLRHRIIAGARQQVRNRHLISDVGAQMLDIYRRIAPLSQVSLR